MINWLKRLFKREPEIDPEQEAREDALFYELMHEFAIDVGRQYMLANEKLKDDPEARMPKEMEERCLEIIRKAYDSEP